MKTFHTGCHQAPDDSILKPLSLLNAAFQSLHQRQQDVLMGGHFPTELTGLVVVLNNKKTRMINKTQFLVFFGAAEFHLAYFSCCLGAVTQRFHTQTHYNDTPNVYTTPSEQLVLQLLVQRCTVS